jgi:hypothetical protein
MIRSRLHRSIAILVLAFVPVVGACKDGKETVDRSKVSNKVEELPSGFVVNPFIPEDKNAKLNVKIPDAGVDANLGLGVKPEGTGGAAAAEPEEAPEGGDESVKETMVEPGADAKERRYQFATGKAETRVVISQAKQGDGPAPSLRMKLQVTPKGPSKDNPGATTIEVRIMKIDYAPASDAEKAAAEKASAALEPATAVVAMADFTARGQLAGEPRIGLSKQDPKALKVAQQVMAPFSEALQALYCPMPQKPVGVGGKWQQKASAGGLAIVSTFQLKSVTDGVLVVTREIDQKIPKQAIKDPRAPKDATLEAEVNSKHEWTTKLDRPATAAKGESKSTQTVTTGGKAQTQAMSMTVTVTMPEK